MVESPAFRWARIDRGGGSRGRYSGRSVEPRSARKEPNNVLFSRRSALPWWRPALVHKCQKKTGVAPTSDLLARSITRPASRSGKSCWCSITCLNAVRPINMTPIRLKSTFACSPADIFQGANEREAAILNVKPCRHTWHLQVQLINYQKVLIQEVYRSSYPTDGGKMSTRAGCHGANRRHRETRDLLLLLQTVGCPNQ